MLYSFIISTSLNAALLAQYVYYNWIAPQATKGKPAASSVVAPAPKAAKAKVEDEPQVAPVDESDVSAPSSATKGAARRRRHA